MLEITNTEIGGLLRGYRKQSRFIFSQITDRSDERGCKRMRISRARSRSTAQITAAHYRLTSPVSRSARTPSCAAAVIRVESKLFETLDVCGHPHEHSRHCHRCVCQHACSFPGLVGT